VFCSVVEKKKTGEFLAAKVVSTLLICLIGCTCPFSLNVAGHGHFTIFRTKYKCESFVSNRFRGLNLYRIMFLVLQKETKDRFKVEMAEASELKFE